MDVRMDGRVAVITGSSTGLGLAMAKEFAASGGSVALLARKADALAQAKAEVQKAAGKSNGRFEAVVSATHGPCSNMPSSAVAKLPGGIVLRSSSVSIEAPRLPLIVRSSQNFAAIRAPGGFSA